jgi:hypothetical protein
MQQNIICDTHECKSNSLRIAAEGLLTVLYVYKVLLQGFFSTSSLALSSDGLILNFKFCIARFAL